MDVDTTSDTVKIESVAVIRHETKSRPENLDLSLQVTKPVNQGLCGSCWAISTTQCLRDRINKHRSEAIPELSFQFLIDCSRHCVSYKGRTGCAYSCDGGFLATAYHFLQRTGTPRENYHPNRHNDESGIDHIDKKRGKSKPCPKRVDENEPLYTCSGFYNVHIHPDMYGITNARIQPAFKTPEQLRANADNIAEEIWLNGSVAVCFNLFSDFKPFWMHPKCGDMVYEIGWQLPAETRAGINPVGDVRWTKSSGPNNIYFKTGHSVSLCGYGVQRGPDGADVEYWICRNSWGPAPQTFNSGFFKIRRGINASAIEADVCAPIVDAKLARSMAAGYCGVPASIEQSSDVAPRTSRAPASARPRSDAAVAFVFAAVIVLILVLSYR